MKASHRRSRSKCPPSGKRSTLSWPWTSCPTKRSVPKWASLTTRMQQLEVEARAAILAEDVHHDHDALTVVDGENRELRSLIGRANVGNIFRGRA